MNAEYHIAPVFEKDGKEQGLYADELAVLNDDEEIVSNEDTIFILCKRCYKKEHFGTYENNVFTCVRLPQDIDIKVK